MFGEGLWEEAGDCFLRSHDSWASTMTPLYPFRRSCVSSTATSGLPRSRWSGKTHGCGARGGAPHACSLVSWETLVCPDSCLGSCLLCQYLLGLYGPQPPLSGLAAAGGKKQTGRYVVRGMDCRAVPRPRDVSGDVRHRPTGLKCGLLPAGAAVLVARRGPSWWPGRSG